jgi:hypothetical protein
MKIPALEAIVDEVKEQTGIRLEYWSPEDLELPPIQQNSHVFGVCGAWSSDDLITEVGGGLLFVEIGNRSMKCGHSHHEVRLSGTKLAIGTCLVVDLANPQSISEIVEFYEPIRDDSGRSS